MYLLRLMDAGGAVPILAGASAALILRVRGHRPRCGGGSSWPPPPPEPTRPGPTTAPPARNADSSTAPTTRPAPSPSRPNSSGCSAPTPRSAGPPGRADLSDHPGRHHPGLRVQRRMGRGPQGVPATEVARRAGHGVAVLLKIYAHCIGDQADAANQRITDALGTEDTEPGPGEEEDTPPQARSAHGHIADGGSPENGLGRRPR